MLSTVYYKLFTNTNIIVWYILCTSADTVDKSLLYSFCLLEPQNRWQVYHRVTDSFWPIRILGQNKSADGWSTISIWLIMQSGLWNEPVCCLVIRSAVILSHQWEKINRYSAWKLSCKSTLLTHSLTDKRFNKMVDGYIIKWVMFTR